MNVLQVIDRLDVGGAERVFVNLVNLLHDRGINVDAMLFSNEGKLIPALNSDVKLVILERKNKFSLSTLYKAHGIFSRYTIVHTHMRHVYTYVRLCQLVFNGKYKLILHDHSGSNYKIPLSLKYMFKPAYYIGVSNMLANWATDKLNIQKKNVFLLQNVILPAAGTPFTCKTTIANLFCVSNIRPEKNLEFAIQIASHFDSLTIYGNAGDEHYYSQINQLTRQQRNVEIIAGKNDFSLEYNKFDLAIHTAPFESGPLVVLEYLAYGIPFLAYRTGEVAEIVYNELPLHFIDSFDEKEWIERIEQIKKQKDISEKLKNVYIKYFNPRDYVAKCIRIYEKVESC